MKLYLLMHRLQTKSVPVLPQLISRVIRFLFSCDIPPTSKLAGSVELMHGGLGIVIHKNSIIGENTKIYQNVTIAGEDGNSPIIGNNVLIGAGAVILGNVTVGNNVKIGANAVVLSDIPQGCTAVGIPAKIVDRK
ncbi:serine acetyltransferase [Bacillus mesophilum]|uniref:Serine acetyltransferase n=2 Tax=Bacillus mesophilum TaxID=1071718 RepID=A0A7V7UVZ2_9BACI|nr:serine acetyltransferase [Bacillus mesophilum]